MNIPNNTCGHFKSLWQSGGPILIPTTVTNQRKSRVRERELAKRAAVASDIEALTGTRPALIARSIDGIARRWNGVKSHTTD